MAHANAEIIARFIAAWSRRDPDELAGFFCEDGCYHNMPTGPVHGRVAIRGFIEAFIRDWTSTDWDVLTLMARATGLWPNGSTAPWSGTGRSTCPAAACSRWRRVRSRSGATISIYRPISTP